MARRSVAWLSLLVLLAATSGAGMLSHHWLEHAGPESTEHAPKHDCAQCLTQFHVRALPAPAPVILVLMPAPRLLAYQKPVRAPHAEHLRLPPPRGPPVVG